MIGRVAKTAVKTDTGRRTGKLGARAAAKAGRGVGKAALKAGKGQAKLTRRAISSQEPVTTRYLKYGFFALAGFAVGALVARSGEREVGQRGETWGTRTPFGTVDASAAGTVSDPASPAARQRPEDPNRTGAEREYSDPSAGPLIGRSRRGQISEVPVQHEEIENRIRTRIGEDPRTLHLPRLNVEVNDGVADIRGEVPSEEDKVAVEEIAAGIEGVAEVRNLLTVNPESPTRSDKAAGGDEPDQPLPRSR
ncbi:MAG: BON domain-containing protein [Actinomycetota bacterium]|nr:BON domain-containing protein [Actinomycetota bacterium]